MMCILAPCGSRSSVTDDAGAPAVRASKDSWMTRPAEAAAATCKTTSAGSSTVKARAQVTVLIAVSARSAVAVVSVSPMAQGPTDHSWVVRAQGHAEVADEGIGIGASPVGDPERSQGAEALTLP